MQINARTLQKIDRAHKKLKAKKREIEKQIRHLKKAGVEFGTLSYKSQTTRGDGTQKQYARLLYPGHKQKYLGVDKVKIKKAQEAIKRSVLLRQAERELDEIDGDIHRMEMDLQYFMESHCGLKIKTHEYMLDDDDVIF